MSLRSEIIPYLDGNSLVCPNIPGPGTLSGSDNGPCFTSEYYILLEKNGMLGDQDKKDYAALMLKCINPEGMLCRVPVGQNDGQEQVDDYQALMAGCFHMDNTAIPRTILWSMIKHLGFMDNVNPGSKKNWASFMFRFPQLIASTITAAFPSLWNPVHIAIRFLTLPLYIFSALVIALACIGTPINSADPRRLAWHLIQVLKYRSVLCFLASLIWYKRLHKDYGPNGMIGVAMQYYHVPEVHPFTKYFID